MKILSSSITPAQVQALQNFAMNVLGVSLKRIDNTWPCCNYKYRVYFEAKEGFYGSWNLIPVLEAIFGNAIYFWDDCYLCGLKEDANPNRIYNK